MWEVSWEHLQPLGQESGGSSGRGIQGGGVRASIGVAIRDQSL